MHLGIGYGAETMIAARDNANRPMTIGAVAQTVGVAATTLRYYEREGILAPSGRTPKGYRLYNADAVTRLEFIRDAQTVGFTLDDIRTLLNLDAGTSCKNVKSLIEHRLTEIDEKLVNLRRVRKALAGAMKRCQTSRKGCPVLTDLKSTRRRKRA